MLRDTEDLPGEGCKYNGRSQADEKDPAGPDSLGSHIIQHGGYLPEMSAHDQRLAYDVVV